MSEIPFAELIQRVRQGDEDAATELVRRYEPAIRRAVRFRLTDARLGSVLESVDICQSVMGSFFMRAASGQYEIDSPEQLQKLLVAMAKNKLAFQARKERAQRRDNRRNVAAADDQVFVSPSSTPSRKVAAREMLQEVHKRLSPEERQLVDWRNDGMEWDEIAKRLNGSAEALRKKLTRALDRVAEELGMEE